MKNPAKKALIWSLSIFLFLSANSYADGLETKNQNDVEKTERTITIQTSVLLAGSLLVGVAIARLALAAKKVRTHIYLHQL